MGLANRVSSGIVWNVAEQFGRRGVTVLTTLLLAYFLAPEDFGLLAMLAMFIALANALMESGFKEALIRMKSPTQADYSTAFFANIGLGLIAAVLLIIVAPYVAAFYNEPELVDLIRVMSIAIPINALQMVQISKLSRDLNFSTQFKAILPASIISSMIAIGFAYMDYGVWALIFQMISSSIFISLFLWTQNIWRPSLTFSIDSLKRMYFFGYKLFLSKVIDVVFKNLSVALIAKFYATTLAGFYYFAERIKEILVMQVVVAIQNVTYPALATKQDDNDQLKLGYSKLMKVVSYLIFPFVLIIASLADLIFEVVFPDKWQPVVMYLQLMLLTAVFLPLHALNLNILNVKGRSDLFLLLEVIKKTLIVIVLFFTIQHGVVYVLVGQFFLSIIAYFINSYFTNSLIGYSVGEQIKDFMPNLLLSSAIAISLYYFQMNLNWFPLVELIVLGVLGIVLYVLCSLLLKLEGIKLFKFVLLSKFNRE